MNKIIGLIVILLFTTNVFGQINYNKRSTIEHGTWSDKTNLVHFTTESGRHKHFYILAYEPYFATGYANTTRKVYLYAVLTNPSDGAEFREHYSWVRVSDAVFKGYFKDGGYSGLS